MEWPEPEPLEIVAELLDARFVADGRIQVRRAGGRIGRIDSALSMHLIQMLGLRVVRLEVVVRDRPRR